MFEALQTGLAILMAAVFLPTSPEKLSPRPENYAAYRTLYEDSALHPDLVAIYAKSPVARAPAPKPNNEEPRQTIDSAALLKDIALLEGKHGGQCVEFIQRYFKSYYAYPDFRGSAGDIVPNESGAEVGAVALTIERSGIGHAALVIAINEDELTLADSNYGQDELIHIGRKIKIGDSRLRGYYVFR